MRLPRLIGVAAVGMLSLSCSDSTAPPNRVTALYLLESIDGDPLPAISVRTPIETITVFWSTLNLDLTGKAAMAEHRRSETGNERTDTRITDYEISGERITIGPPCPNDPLADCALKRVGRIEGSTLTLPGYDGNPNTLTFVYRLAASN